MDLKFSLGSFHKIESEARVSLKSLNVKNIKQINTTVLDRRRKDELVKAKESLSTIRSQEKLQGEKSDQLEAFKITMDDKLPSWASVGEKNNGKLMAQKVLKEAVKSAIKKCDREYNVVRTTGWAEEQTFSGKIRFKVAAFDLLAKSKNLKTREPNRGFGPLWSALV